jgi:predicted GNAT family acetyltransferase
MNEVTIKEVETFKQFDILLNEEVIGSAEIKYPDMTLNNFFIYPEYRNKGYGQKALKDFIKNFGITNLWVNPSNEAAKHIYQKLGFVLDESPNYVAMRLK